MSAAPKGAGCIRLALTMGDPCGVGPEICIKALTGEALPPEASVVVVGSLSVLREAADAVGVHVRLNMAAASDWSGAAEGVSVLDLDNFPPDRLSERKPTAAGGRASLQYIERAVQMAVSGQAHAIVTAPISKEAIGAAGSPHPGHTEMLAELTGASRPVMVLVSGRLRVAFVTTHLALRDVSACLTDEGICATGLALSEGLRGYFGVKRPRLALCGLNPHCGDGGRFGDEEQRVIVPAVLRLREKGLDIRGPLPADTLFAAADRDFDGVVALYHDQGMIPIKMGGLDRAVNVTLGLPVIRTSPGHGTAYDIAGTGAAREGSLVAAMRLAVSMARVRSRGLPGD